MFTIRTWGRANRFRTPGQGRTPGGRVVAVLIFIAILIAIGSFVFILATQGKF